jgi:hypothetical protein
MFPELPDAKIEIRKPIAAPSGCSNRPMRASALRPAHYEAAHSTEHVEIVTTCFFLGAAPSGLKG